MPVITIFYALVAAAFVLAYVRLKVLDLRRGRAARRLGAVRGTAVVPLVHRVETVTLLGLPLYRYVTVPLAGEVVAALDRVDAERPVDLVVHMPGGVALDSEAIAAALSERDGDVTLVVPACALSGAGTLVDAADTLLVGPGAVLDPPGDGDLTSGPLPDEVWRLLALYDQPPRRRGSPLFLPLSKRGRVRGRAATGAGGTDADTASVGAPDDRDGRST